MYVIATDSRRKNEALFMVDRGRQRASFWSNRLDDVMTYSCRGAALRKAGALRFNRPRVMPLAEAERIAADQSGDRDHWGAMDESEAGWDGHKDICGESRVEG